MDGAAVHANYLSRSRDRFGGRPGQREAFDVVRLRTMPVLKMSAEISRDSISAEYSNCLRLSTPSQAPPPTLSVIDPGGSKNPGRGQALGRSRGSPPPPVSRTPASAAPTTAAAGGARIASTSQGS